jgi:carbonic anhydrase/acetyltransferase-like protein (isoleucine patch superfamily)
MGCTIEDDVFLATGTTLFHRARVGRGAEVRINAVVHVATVLAPGTTVPIGWVAVGDPARLFPPGEHEAIWAVQRELDFPRTVYGLQRDVDGRVDMGELTGRLIESFETHRTDEPCT